MATTIGSFSAVLSAMLWCRDRTAINRALFFVWIAMLASGAVQSSLSNGELWIILGFSTGSVFSIALAQLCAVLHDISFSSKKYWILSPGMVAVSLVLETMGMPFWLKAIPPVLAITLPICAVLSQVWLLPKKSLLSNMFSFTLVCYILHVFDFPFVRMNESFAILGYAIIAVNCSMLSVIGPAFALEKTSQEKTKLEAVKKLKDKFFANISHELRTPLTMISAPIASLLDQPLEEEQRKDLLSIKRNSSRLLLFIDELLDLARLDAGRLSLTVAEVELSNVFESVFEAVSSAARSKHIDMRFVQNDATPDLYGDRHRLEIVVTNLVSNAVKHTPGGCSIELSVTDMGDTIRAEIKDTGPGISKDELPKIFGRFKQGKNSASRGGVGIGLALSKELIELHGGKIWVESTLGEGTTFAFEIPKGSSHFSSDHVIVDTTATSPTPVRTRRQSPSTPMRSPTESGEPPLEPMGTIVLAEDNHDLRRFVAKVLKKSFNVFQAPDGEDALRLIQEHRPDAVVSDIMMPKMTGIELCQAIRSTPELLATPVILLTAKSGIETELEAYSSGANDFVGKPFHPGVLLARVTAQVQLRKLAAQLVSSEKLAALGTMAAGIAHEIKNPVNSVMSAASIIKRPAVNDQTMAKMADVISDGSQRIADIVSAITAHARPADPGAMCQVQEGIDSTLQLLSFRMKDVAVNVNVDPKARAHVPAAKANQVFLNIIDNAIRSGASSLDIHSTKTGNFITISIADDGPGIPPEIIDKIFDPFFTTRDYQNGTGLGLYICNQIVTDAGGNIKITKAQPTGARFDIRLPLLGSG